MNKKVEYVGKDLEAMDFAVNYHRWILVLMKPFLGKHLVEVGAGTGAFSELLLETAPETLSLVEPSAMFETLQTNLAKHDSATKICAFPNIFAEVAAQIETEQSPDSIIYINVLEHIEDDRLELEIIHRTLREKGRVFVFVPALPVLFSEFDKQIGHFRRYRKTELAEKFRAVGFRILLSRYFDAAGIFPWLVKYRLLKSLTMESGAVHLYDKFVVPVVKPVESFLPLPLGKNLLFVAEKVMSSQNREQ
jgi:SAM-dependent methyltransferase